MAEDLLFAAAEVPDSLRQEVAAAGASLSPKTLSSFPFSMYLLALKAEPGTDDLRALSPEPGAAPLELWVRTRSGFSTVLPDGSFSDVVVQVDGDSATGSARFRREGMVEGNVEFTARKVDGAWELTEIGVPDQGGVIRRDSAGAWKLHETE
jgi:hypothetical protein